VAQRGENLGLPAQALHASHAAGELRRVGQEGSGGEFHLAAPIGQLNGQATHVARCLEHIGHQMAGHVPTGLAAGGGVHKEQQPPGRPTRRLHGQAIHPGQEGGHGGAGSGFGGELAH
jgi:hypothetical protein